MIKEQKFANLVEEMRCHIPDYIMDRGYDYFERELVEGLQINDPWITASVLGQYGDYEVKVHMDDFGRSSCDCPYDDYCKHMAAVVFAVTENDNKEQGCDEEDGDTVSPAASQKNDDVQSRLQKLDKEELLQVLTELMNAETLARQAIRLILNEKERTVTLHSREVQRMGLYTSLDFYERTTLLILQECEGLFKEPENDGYDEVPQYNRYRYDDCYDESEWDFSAGLERLNRYGEELLNSIEPAHYISGTVGLLIAVRKLAAWFEKYDEEEYGYDLVDGCHEFESYLGEALARVHGYCKTDPEADVFIRELLEWIVKQCEDVEELLDWTAILSYCVGGKKHFRNLHEQVLLLDPAFPTGLRNANEQIRKELIHWWVELALYVGLEDTARRVAAELDSLDDMSIQYMFARYYEREGDWPQAIAALQTCLEKDSRSNKSNYEWMIRLCEQVGDEAGKKKWNEQLFLAYPDFAAFQRTIALFTAGSERESKINEWILRLEYSGRITLVAEILISFGDPERAWQYFTAHESNFDVDEIVQRKLFAAMKKHDPGRLIPVYKQLVKGNINSRTRGAYAKAARWLKDLQEVCLSTGQTVAWTTYYNSILTEYRRFRALMEEIQKAGLGKG